MMKTITLAFAITAAAVLSACEVGPPSTDQKQAQAQAASLEQAHEKIGMPAISNFTERRMAKDLYELRDKSISTHVYIFNERESCLVYVGPAVGYGLPYSAEFTAPTRTVDVCPNAGHYCWEQIPQAEPNGLFMPDSAEGTWVMLKDPNSEDVKPVYMEPRVVVSPFRVPSAECRRPAPAVEAASAKGQ